MVRRRSLASRGPRPRVRRAAAVLILLLATAGGPGSLHANPVFAPPRTYATAHHPVSVAIGDLNNDGIPDLAVAGATYTGPPYVGTVSVLLGDGFGRFNTRADYVPRLESSCVAIADLNHDGRNDLVATSYETARVTVLTGDGSGTFAAHLDLATGYGPLAVAVGDLNGDGHPDLAVANSGSFTVSVLLGKGDGTFQPRADYATGQTPIDVAIGDVNGDGKPDLAVANAGLYPDYAGTVSVLPGNGDGTFRPRTDYATQHEAEGVAIGDLNRDGVQDVAVSDRYVMPPVFSEWIDVFLGQRNGPLTGSLVWLSDFPRSLEIGDVDGDGLLDFAVLGDEGVYVLLGQPVLGFGDPIRYCSGCTGSSLALGDLDRDGRLDMVITEYGSDAVVVLLQVGGTPADVGAPTPAGLALAGLRPDPARSDVSLVFSLPDDRAAQIELFDVNGRRVLARDVGALGTGAHVLRLEEGARLPAGVYLVRLTHDGRALVARGAIVR